VCVCVGKAIRAKYKNHKQNGKNINRSYKKKTFYSRKITSIANRISM